MSTHMLTEAEPLTAAVRSDGDPRAHALSTGFRLRYLVRFGLVVLCGAFAAGLALCLLLAGELGSYAQNVFIINGLRDLVVGSAILSALIQVALIGAMVSVLALLASHKVAGPMVRLGGVLRGIAQGRLPGRVAFRHGDQVGKIETELNELSRLIRQRHETVELKVREARSAVRECERTLRGPDAGAARRAAAKELRERAGELAVLLGGTEFAPGAEPPERAGEIAPVLAKLAETRKPDAAEGRA